MRNSIPIINNVNPQLYGPTLNINSNGLPLHAWYSANDAGSFGGTYPSNNADIATIYDISGNGWHLVGGADKPIFKTGVGPNGTNCFSLESTGRNATASCSGFFDAAYDWTKYTVVMALNYFATSYKTVFMGASNTFRAAEIARVGGTNTWCNYLQSRTNAGWLATSWGTDANSHPTNFNINDNTMNRGLVLLPSASGAAFQIGGNNFSIGYQIAELAIYRGSLTKDVVLRLHRGIMKKYAFASMDTNYALVAIGNSTTELGSSNYWPQLLAAQSPTPEMDVYNCGHGGGTTQNILDQFDEYVRLARDIKSSGRRCIFTVLTGHNDGGDTGPINTLLGSYFNHLRSQGHKTLVIGRTPRSTENNAATHDTFNQICLDNAAKHDAVIDLRGYDLGTPYNLPATDPSNYYDDTQHFSDAGRTRLVAIIGPTFNTLIGS